MLVIINNMLYMVDIYIYIYIYIYIKYEMEFYNKTIINHIIIYFYIMN